MKTCLRCEENKEIGLFYTHKQMADGHLNICKECTKKRVRERSRSPEGREYDRLRNKTKKRKEWLIRYQKLRRARYPLKDRARRVLNRAVGRGIISKPNNCESCNMERPVQGHHEDYSKPLIVVWLCESCHRALHAQYKRKD